MGKKLALFFLFLVLMAPVGFAGWLDWLIGGPRVVMVPFYPTDANFNNIDVNHLNVFLDSNFFGNVGIDGNLYVLGDITFEGDINVTGDFDVNGVILGTDSNFANIGVSGKYFGDGSALTGVSKIDTNFATFGDFNSWYASRFSPNFLGDANFASLEADNYYSAGNITTTGAIEAESILITEPTESNTLTIKPRVNALGDPGSKSGTLEIDLWGDNPTFYIREWAGHVCGIDQDLRHDAAAGVTFTGLTVTGGVTFGGLTLTGSSDQGTPVLNVTGRDGVDGFGVPAKDGQGATFTTGDGGDGYGGAGGDGGDYTISFGSGGAGTVAGRKGRLNINGDTITTGDINAVGLSVDNNIFAPNVWQPQFAFAHTDKTRDLNTAGDWQPVEFDKQTSLKGGITHTYNNDTNARFYIGESGIYEIHYRIDFEDSAVAPTSNVVFRVSNNGVEVEGSVVEVDLDKKDWDTVTGGHCFAHFSPGDSITLEWTADETTVSLITDCTYGDHCDAAQFSIKRVA